VSSTASCSSSAPAASASTPTTTSSGSLYSRRAELILKFGKDTISDVEIEELERIDESLELERIDESLEFECVRTSASSSSSSPRGTSATCEIGPPLVLKCYDYCGYYDMPRARDIMIYRKDTTLLQCAQPEPTEPDDSVPDVDLMDAEEFEQFLRDCDLSAEAARESGQAPV